MTAVDPHPIPPVAPPPPHPSPPPVAPPEERHLPVPPAGLAASATHGAGYELKGKSKHKTTYKVTGTGTGATPTDHPDASSAVQAALALLRQAEANETSTAEGTLPAPTTVMISSQHTLPAYREEPSGLHHGAPRGAY